MIYSIFCVAGWRLKAAASLQTLDFATKKAETFRLGLIKQLLYIKFIREAYRYWDAAK
jgi:hypothetical protein